jgi:hypothetical protein
LIKIKRPGFIASFGTAKMVQKLFLFNSASSRFAGLWRVKSNKKGLSFTRQPFFIFYLLLCVSYVIFLHINSTPLDSLVQHVKYPKEFFHALSFSISNMTK